VLMCTSGHRFEVGRRGYAALIAGRSPLVRSDPAVMLDAVDAQWASGGLSPIAAAVDAMLPAARGMRVLDFGADLGHVLAIARGHRLDLRGLLVSGSPSALVRGMARSGADGLLADPARAWPVRDGIADVVLCVLADHRPAEFHRVLKPGGVAILVAAAERARELDDDLYQWFEHDQTRVVAGEHAGGFAVLLYRRRRRMSTW
jgi:23S rRNA (guanine745-N1)-methyltransferase